MCATSLPGRYEAVAKAVDQFREHDLQGVENPAKEHRRKLPVAEALEGLADAKNFAEVEARKQGRTPRFDKSVQRESAPCDLIALEATPCRIALKAFRSIDP